MTSDSKDPKGKKRPAPTESGPKVMPANVRPGQVMGLVEITGSSGSHIDVSKIADEMGADIAVLLPVLDSAEMLGLVADTKGDVSLTDLGISFQETSRDKVKVLKDRLVELEPFRTAYETVQRKGSATAAEVAESLGSKGIRFHDIPEMNDMLIQSSLIHWMTLAGLLRFNGKVGRFYKA